MKKSVLIAFGIFSIAFAYAQTSDTIQYTGAIVTYTIPACVTNVTIEARGASGGNNTSSSVTAGLGATMIGDFAVTPGTQLQVLVGQNNQSGNGGGGGTFVVDMTNNPWIVAGGGGGSGAANDATSKHGQITTAGGNGTGGGGNGGTAGSGGFIGASFASGAGAGLLTNGQDGWTPGSGGQAFINGGAGANVGFGVGGFGGGGNGSGYVVGAGGGGYSGGGAGSNSVGGGGVGGGGGSFNAGTNQVNTSGANTGNGIVIITYNMGPQSPAAVSGSNSVCSGSTIVLVADSVSGVTSYNWTIGDSAFIVSGQGNDTIMLNVGSMSDVVSVTVTGPCGTSLPTTFSYTVNPLPTLSVTATSTVVCEGSTVVLSAGGASTYAWSTGSTDANDTLVVNNTTTYTVIGTDANGCSVTDSIMISTNPNPVVNLGADTIVCSPLMLDAGNAGSTFMWSDSTAMQTNTAAVSGAYSVVVTDGNGCSATDAINVSVGGNFTVAGSAAMNFVCTGEPTVQLFESPSGGTWTGAGVFGSTFEPDTAGAGLHSLVYTYTDSLGCSGTDTVVINVDLCLGIENASALLANVYPNPNSGTFTITFNNSQENVVVEMLDVNGRTVFTQAYDVNAGDQKQLDLSGEANGIYMLRVTSVNGVSTQRVIISE